MDIRQASFDDDPVVRGLVTELQQEFTVRYGGPDATPLERGAFEPPAGAFFVGQVLGAAVAMGGWRFRPDVRALGRDTAAEVKRMYVVPWAQRRGYARIMLSCLESTAREAGADVMVLETGLAQPEAIALYESSGYEAVEGFGHYRDSDQSRYFGKRL
jgi:ribosomal protein S18 acetylase RimI-like enzyme